VDGHLITYYSAVSDSVKCW